MGLDEAGLEQLFQQHYTALVMYAYKLLRSQEEAEDAVQEVFISVWKNRETLDTGRNLKAYLYTATYNRCVSLLRKHGLPTVSIQAFSEAPIAGEGNIEADMHAAELRAAIYEEIRKLPDKCREAFLLSRREGMSYKAIASHLGLSLKTVENHIGNALKRIRQRLFHDDGSPWKGQLFSWLLLLLQMGSAWPGENFGKSCFFSSFPLGGKPQWIVLLSRVKYSEAVKL